MQDWRAHSKFPSRKPDPSPKRTILPTYAFIPVQPYYRAPETFWTPDRSYLRAPGNERWVDENGVTITRLDWPTESRRVDRRPSAAREEGKPTKWANTTEESKVEEQKFSDKPEIKNILVNKISLIPDSQLEMTGKCERCKGITADGKRCKNKISCEKSCTGYCWVHSKGYQKGTNEVCTFPKKRRPSKGRGSRGKN